MSEETLGGVLLAIAAVLVLPQVMRDEPNQLVFVLGLLVALAGGVLITDSRDGGF